MILLTTTMSTSGAGAQPKTNPWMASLYGGIAAALITAAFSLLLPTNIPVLWILALILIGVGPVLGYQLAAGQLGQDWKALVGGLIGGIPILGPLILWPLFVWLFNRNFSLGQLWLGSLIGVVLGVVVFFIIGLMIGQDPAWVGTGGAIMMGVWGGACAAFMASSAKA
ncbi:MAG: hypothetical protein H3C34_16340 [Caldilineaceae bacterium]|nr:hypothetical protein [Caldilineaceae bacterium]